MSRSNPVPPLAATSRDDVEIIDLDSDELGEFGALATCVDGNEAGFANVIAKIPLQKRIDIAMKAINKKGSPAEIATKYDVPVDAVYGCAAELILAGKQALERKS